MAFEDLWNARREAPKAARARLAQVLAKHPAFARSWRRVLSDIRRAPDHVEDDF